MRGFGFGLLLFGFGLLVGSVEKLAVAVRGSHERVVGVAPERVHEEILGLGVELLELLLAPVLRRGNDEWGLIGERVLEEGGVLGRCLSLRRAE